MNYLAHLFLAGAEPQAIIGSLLGDFTKGPIPTDWPPALQAAVALHRRIDSFTDRHPVVRLSRQRFQSRFRRYAGILIDLYYDHFLACEWPRYSTVPLEQFRHSVYTLLHDAHPTFPPAMQRSVAYMLRYDLLLSYRDVDGIARALRGIETRLKRPSALGEAVTDLRDHYSAFSSDFGHFFPQLIDFVGTQRHNRASV